MSPKAKVTTLSRSSLVNTANAVGWVSTTWLDLLTEKQSFLTDMIELHGLCKPVR